MSLNTEIQEGTYFVDASKPEEFAKTVLMLDEMQVPGIVRIDSTPGKIRVVQQPVPKSPFRLIIYHKATVTLQLSRTSVAGDVWNYHGYVEVTKEGSTFVLRTS